MQAGFKEVKETVGAYGERIRGIENREAGCQPLLNARITAIEAIQTAQKAEITALKETIQALKEIVVELRQANKLMAYIGGPVVLAVIAWIINQLLGLIK